ncbi:MAG: serine/threonine protein kinase [Candidatus Melainabacteria bacterium]|nr:serine/threonine protein kinase [Candidatus Melainabacteria bacterium]
MLKLQQAEIDRLRSMSPADLDRHLFWITAISIVLGFAVSGACGVGFAMIMLCIAGLFLQIAKRASGPDSPLYVVTTRTKLSFQTFFLSVAAASMLLLLFKTGIDGAMNFMSMWALMFCLVSPVIKFTSRQWRGVALVALSISVLFIGNLAYGFIVHLPVFARPLTVLPETMQIVYALYALAALALITSVLVAAGRLTKLWSSRGDRLFGGKRDSWSGKVSGSLRRATKQVVAELPVYAFLFWYLGIVFFFTVPAGCVGDMLTGTFIASARDANVYPYYTNTHDNGAGLCVPPLTSVDPLADGVDNPPISRTMDEENLGTFETGEENFSQPIFHSIAGDMLTAPDYLWSVPSKFQSLMMRESNITEAIVKSIVALGFIVLPFTLIMRGAQFYAALTRRLIGSKGRLRLSESALAALRDTGDKLRLKYESRFFSQAARTFWWLLFWYVAVFSMVAFTEGGIGSCIRSWIDFSLRDSNFLRVSTETNLQMRYFMAALLAMYMCGPLAVTGCVFLPHRSGRQVVVNEDGISLPDGPFGSMWLRTFRLYVDIKSVSLKGKTLPEIEHAKDRRRVKLQFRTGGSLSFRVMDMPPEDLRLLLERIDEHAEDCKFSAEIVELRVKLSKESETKTAHESATRKGKFKSSIFVPFVGGEKIDRHELRIVKVLANKPLSAVYLVRLADGRLAVLKQLVMPKDDEASREHLRIFQRECELMRELQHEGIARVLDAFNEGNSHFLLLEHFKGQDLKTVVDTFGARTVEEVAGWGLSLCEVLDYLHSQEIIHRDVTPENIVVGEHAGVRLIDFGAAHQFIEGITGTLIGKQSYVAPEQLRGKATKRSDIYSLGVTLSFLLTGKEPVALMQCEPELGNSKSAVLMRKLIMAMTDFEEERRPENIQAVRQILLAILTGNVVAPDLGLTKPEIGATKPGSREDVPVSDAEPRSEDVPVSDAEPRSEVVPVSDAEQSSVIAPLGDVHTDDGQNNEEAKLIVRTIKLMADAVPAETIKVESPKKKVKVKRRVDREKQ